MLNRKTNNFNDFSRYYSEENQELLEKKAKFDPYIIFTLLLTLILFSYYMYTFLLQQKQVTPSLDSNKIIEKKNPTIKKKPLEDSIIDQETFTLKQKKLIEKLVIEKIKQEKVIKRKENNLINSKKEQVLEKKIIISVKPSDKQNLYKLSSQLEKMLNKEHSSLNNKN